MKFIWFFARVCFQLAEREMTSSWCNFNRIYQSQIVLTLCWKLLFAFCSQQKQKIASTWNKQNFTRRLCIKFHENRWRNIAVDQWMQNNLVKIFKNWCVCGNDIDYLFWSWECSDNVDLKLKLQAMEIRWC